ncbi:MAG: protein kinase [Roseburia sp.]|nr:protein kinase [Roseburia sp.]
MMHSYTREELEKNYKALKIFRQDEDCKIELVEDSRDNTRWIKRTYCEDKREIFHLLAGANPTYLAEIKAIAFDVDTIVLEEYIEGQRLEDYLANYRISSRDARNFVYELLHAISAIHKLGIIHRDIKPGNILIDFGIARIYRQDKSKDTELLGTVEYAAPEQFGYSQSDFRTDIFSIGMTCRDLNQAIKKNRFLQKIERKCTKMDPRERYPNVQALLKEFQKRSLAVRGGIVLSGIFAVSLGTGVYFLCQQQELTSQAGDLICVPDENRLFVGQDTAPCLLFTENSEKSAQISLAKNEDPVSLWARLTADGLSLSVTDASGSGYDFQLSDEYNFPEDYPDTSLYGEVLFFDTDQDGKDEIWVAISDRALVSLINGETGVNQNYMAGWCIFQREDGSFVLADGQLWTMGRFRIGTASFPRGIWQDEEQAACMLEEGILKYLNE